MIVGGTCNWSKDTQFYDNIAFINSTKEDNFHSTKEKLESNKTQSPRLHTHTSQGHKASQLITEVHCNKHVTSPQWNHLFQERIYINNSSTVPSRLPIFHQAMLQTCHQTWEYSQYKGRRSNNTSKVTLKELAHLK